MNEVRKEMSVFLDRQTVRRKRDWRKKLRVFERMLLSVAIVFAGLACLYGLYQLIFLSDTFAVKKIVVEGKWKYLTAELLAETSGIKEGDNLFWINVSHVHERLRANPWVSSVAVHRRLPDTLWVYVEEYCPVAAMLSNEMLYYIDADGKIFKRVDAVDDKDFPVLTGINLDGSDKLAKDMIHLIDIFKASKFGIGRDVSEVHFDPIAGFSLMTAKDPMQILFGHAAFGEGMERIDRIIDLITQNPGRIQYMLANEPGRITVRYQI